MIHVAGFNLGLIMRLLVGTGAPRELLARASAHLLILTAANTITGILVVATNTEVATLVVTVDALPRG